MVSSPNVGRLALSIIVPITDWKEVFDSYSWMTRLEPDAENGLSKTSVADGFQVRSVSPIRFTEKLGAVSKDILYEIEATIHIAVEIL